MAIRKIKFINGDYYHIYNRGVDKRIIFLDKDDKSRFLNSLNIFNTVTPVGSIFEFNILNKSKKQKFGNPVSKLVEIIAFNILDNHFHLVLRQVSDNGISLFMKSLGGGYTKYFNEKYERPGSLFQGPFKASFVGIENLEKIVSYVNLNHVVHKFGNPVSKWGVRSSWEQYCLNGNGVVSVNKISNFNKNNSIEIVNDIIKNREEMVNNLETRFPNKIT